jgi:hypothetical protein
MKQGILIGMLIGLVAGYLVAKALDEEPVDRAREPEAPAAEDPVDERETPEPVEEWSPPEAVTDTGTVTMDGRIFLGGKLLEPKPVDELRQTLAWARQNRDWANYRKAILELGVTGTPEAQALLVEIMGDETLFMPGPWLGQIFYMSLKDSEVEGILEAARTRAEIDLVEKKGTRWEGRGWLSLVALHAGEAELDWVLSLGTSRNRWMEVDKALAEGSRNPLAAERLAERIVAGEISSSSSYMNTFAEENPNVAFRAAVDALPKVCASDPIDAFRLLGSATTAATLSEAVAVLNGLDSPQERMTAIYAVGVMHERGLDTSGLQPLLDDLRVILERAATGQVDLSNAVERLRLTLAITLVEENEVTWDAPTLAALRVLAGRPHRKASKTLDRIEEKRTPKEQGWNPERG